MSLESGLLHNPLVQGMIAKALADVLHDLFADKGVEDAIKKNEGWLHPTSLILSLLVTALDVAMTSGLGSLSVAQIQASLVTLIQVFLGMKAAGTSTVRKLAVQCKEKISTSLQ